MLDKAALRQQLGARRRAHAPGHTAAADELINARLVAWSTGAGIDTLAVYWPLAGEPDLAPACAQLHAAGVRLALPVVVARGAALAFAHWTPGEAMHVDAMGIAVPAALRPMERPPALVIPCLGFNGQGYRLGYGGGFYDRTLAAPPRPRTVGVGYGWARVDFEVGTHDVPLDLILTEQ
jgi:5,10-methenyltetrahydrofolate synthetase